jgi:hypothetical protein
MINGPRRNGALGPASWYLNRSGANPRLPLLLTEQVLAQGLLDLTRFLLNMVGLTASMQGDLPSCPNQY